jgi:hypothetical protein
VSYPAFVWPPIPSGGSSPPPPGSTPALALRTNVNRWVDGDAGSDTNPGSEALPWKTLAPWLAFIAQFTVIDNAVATLHINPTTLFPVLSVPWQLPILANGGKIVWVGTDERILENDAGVVQVIGFPGSDNSFIGVVPSFPSEHNVTGWEVVCVAGVNLGQRRTCALFVNGEGGAEIFVVAPFSSSTAGDTFEFHRPVTRVDFAAVIFGASPNSGVLDGSGLYLVNLVLRDSPTFEALALYTYGCEYVSDESLSGNGIAIGPYCAALFGVGDTIMPWVGNTASWNGLGLAMVFEDLTPATSIAVRVFGGVSGFAQVPVGELPATAPASARGYFVATACECSGEGGTIVVSGASKFFGMPSGSADTIVARQGGLIVLDYNPPETLIYILFVFAQGDANALFATDPGTIVTVGQVAFQSIDGALMRATARATIDVRSDTGGPSGSVSGSGNAQDATGQGLIVWDTQPTMNVGTGIGAELAVDGATAANTALATAPSVFADATGQSVITRRAVLPTTSFEKILGPLFVDEWDRELGASASQWQSRRGRVLAATGPVTYAPDGTNFHGGSVIGTDGSTSWLVGTALTSMAPSGTHPYLCGVSRFSAISGIPCAVSMAGASADQLLLFAVTLNFEGQITGIGVTGPASDNNVHFWEIWPDGTNFNFAVDGVLFQLANAGATTQDATTFVVGNRDALDLPMQGFHSRYIVASAPPSSAQRSAMLALAQNLDGPFP